MKKYLFILFFLFNFLNADTIYNSKCVKSFFGNYHNSTANSTLVLNYSDGSSSSIPYDINILNSLTLNDNKFVYTTVGTLFQRCTSLDNSIYYGMTKEQYNFLMSLTGILIGFSILFFILGV